MLSEDEFRERAQRVQWLVLDVDGVLTDGSILLDELGREVKRFHVRDGFALRSWQRAGFRSVVISGRSSPSVAHRAREVGIDRVYQGYPMKGPVFRDFLAREGVEAAAVCATGDDLPDLPVMLASGLSATVADAMPEVRARAHWISQLGGGRGAVRELIDALLRAKGLGGAILDHYARAA